MLLVIAHLFVSRLKLSSFLIDAEFLNWARLSDGRIDLYHRSTTILFVTTVYARLFSIVHAHLITLPERVTR